MIPEKGRYAVLLALLVVSAAFFATTAVRWSGDRASADETLYLVSTVDALLDGVYDGAADIDSILARGDTGIGTLEGLDGELIVVDGEAWQVKGDGTVVQVEGSAKTPFAAVTTFEPEIVFEVTGPTTLADLEASIEAALPSVNLPCAVLVEGAFTNVTARSVDRQEKPYPLLAEATKNQHVFTFGRGEGSLVGFRLPKYLAGVNVPGFHLHYLADDRTGGGHLLDATVEHATVSLDITPEIRLSLPNEGGFLTADLSGNREAELTLAER
ncbi:acetolactate decarboxylase [uncultured Methanofollis sp.]|uniref:acetolactate decarboxylase n=1 Tax=uncultured Methanofollis sp. TaxID=262500 RepID=UPI00262897EC|nr:acetolactate decarboxylase [uncultured Methanofollis sp.]